MCPPPTAVIFDLDGTLVQTREASWNVFRPISSRHGLGIDAPEDFYQLFAENFFASLRAACATPQLADVVTAEFMAALDEHYSPAMVPGLIDVVKAMVPYSKLAVLSSNTTAVVRRVLRSNKLEYCFAHVFGGDVEPDKSTGIARFMSDAATGSGRLCRAYYDEPSAGDDADREADPRKVVLITDTVGDVEAAVASGIRAVGVAWGMHTEEQLIAAGAEFVAIWPQELLAHLYVQVEESCSCAAPADTSGSRPSGRAQAAGDRRRERRRRANRPSARPAPTERAPEPPPRTTAATRRFSDPLLAEAIARTVGAAQDPVAPAAQLPAGAAAPTFRFGIVRTPHPALAEAIARTIR
jgi:phosphoglycolate phosphatase